MITKVEQKYNQTINELKEKHKIALNALEDRNQSMEREIKSLNSKLLSQNNGALVRAKDFEKKLISSRENEK